MSQPSSFFPGRFVWHELNTHDPEKSRAFYAELFGWTFDTSDPAYAFIMSGDTQLGGMLKAYTPSMPTHWLPYVSVQDVDASQQLAVDAGCKVMAGPMQVEPGRFVVMRDPQGAVFTLWRATHGDPPEVVVPAGGSFCWDQLNTADPDAAFAVYAKIFGWTRTAFPGAADSSTLLRGERMAASLMKAPPGVPAHWLSYVLVDTLQATRERAQRLGGTVLVERIEVPGMGAFSVLQDTLGGIVAAFQATPR